MPGAMVGGSSRRKSCVTSRLTPRPCSSVFGVDLKIPFIISFASPGRRYIANSGPETYDGRAEQRCVASDDDRC